MQAKAMSTPQQLRWREPWFFSLRMRDRSGWKRKGWLIAAVFVAMMVGWYLDQRYGKGPRIGLSGAILLCLGISVFVGFLNDLSVAEIQAGDEGVARAVYGHGFGAVLYKYEDMLGFFFFPPPESGRQFGLLALALRTGVVLLGVPHHLSPSRVTECLRSHGVPEMRSNQHLRATPR